MIMALIILLCAGREEETHRERHRDHRVSGGRWRLSIL